MNKSTADRRIPILVAVLLMAGVVYQMRTRPAPPPPAVVRETQDPLKLAETIHQAIADSLALDPAAKIEHAVEEATAHYATASTNPDSFVAARACFGMGQLQLLRGDTTSALEAWQQVVSLGSDDFSTMRAMKSIADAASASGDTILAHRTYGEIVRIFGDSELTQAGKLIVNASRRK